MTESALQRSIMLAVSQTGARVLRNNVGVAWQGKAVRLANGDVLIKQAQAVKYGLCVGSADFIGWTRDGRFLAIEVKAARGRLTPEQAQFLNAVRQAGGIAVEARSVEQAVAACGM